MKIQRVTTKGLIRDDDKIFMVRDQAGNWELPGGKIEFGESPEITLKREFLEELGVNNVEIGKIINVWDFTTKANQNDYHFVVLVYECKADLSNIKISDEHIEYKWIDLKDIDKYPMRDGYKETLMLIINSGTDGEFY